MKSSRKRAYLGRGGGLGGVGETITFASKSPSPARGRYRGGERGPYGAMPRTVPGCRRDGCARPRCRHLGRQYRSPRKNPFDDPAPWKDAAGAAKPLDLLDAGGDRSPNWRSFCAHSARYASSLLFAFVTAAMVYNAA